MNEVNYTMSEDEIIEAGNNKSYADIRTQEAILRESVRHFLSRYCSRDECCDNEHLYKFKGDTSTYDTPCGTAEMYKAYYEGMYETTDGIIYIVMGECCGGSIYEQEFDDLPLDEVVYITKLVYDEEGD